MASGATFAESLLESAAKQTAVQSINNAAPGAIQTIQATEQSLGNAKTLQQTITTSPEVIKENSKAAAKEAIDQKINSVIPEEAKQSVETMKNGKKAVGKLKNKVSETPKAVKEGAKRKATEKALDLLR